MRNGGEESTLQEIYYAAASGIHRLRMLMLKYCIQMSCRSIDSSGWGVNRVLTSISNHHGMMHGDFPLDGEIQRRLQESKQYKEKCNTRTF